MRTQRNLFLCSAAIFAVVCMQSATAADLPVKAPPPVVVPVSIWDGLYVAFSAGGTYTEADSSEVGNANNTLGLAIGGFNPTLQAPYQYTDSMSGDEYGAVFSFTMGYNVVWGSFLMGIQSEVSYNNTELRLQGLGNNSANLNVPIPGFPIGVNSSRSGDVFARLSHNWTISEMLRLGWVFNDWQVYGLIGWSWGGFNFDGYSAGITGLERGGLGGIVGLPFGQNRNDTAFTMDGFTWGVGIEKSFGWLRAFIQYKGINFESDDIAMPVTAAGSLTVGLPAIATNITATDSVGGAATRVFSADINQFTAGITIPLRF